MVDSPAPRTHRSGGGAVSRRSVIALAAAGAAGLVASGCSVDNPVDDDTAPKRPTELSPDVAVATSALAEIRILSAAVTSTIARFPATRPQLAPLARMHQAHERSLANAVPARAKDSSSATPAPYVVSRQREVALADLRAREQQLHGSLAGLALRAQSGDFARLLASMGAAVSQRLAVWS